MASRDFRIVNMAEGQKIESDKVLKRIGEISYRDIGILAKIGLFNTGKACITEGLRVVSGGGMVVNIPMGTMLQRIPSGDILPIIANADQTITMDAASGVSRIDIVECQIKSVIDKNDISQSVLDPGTGVISLENIKRDIKYYLQVQKKTGNTTATAATAGVLTGTIGIPGTIDLSANYLLNLADGEDGSFQEIDLRGATPEATTAAEIVSAINSATGRVMASIGGGNVLLLTGNGTGETSYFEIKPPANNSDADALETVFGVSSAGAYNYVFQGVNDWIKLCEIDIGAATTVITSGLIRNIDQKSTWASDGDQVYTLTQALQPLSERTARTTALATDLLPIETALGQWESLSLQKLIDYIFPVGSFYVQYPDAASNVDATAFPTSARPATMFGGTWVEQFNTEGVVFQTAGYDGAGRTNGLMTDQMQGFGITLKAGGVEDFTTTPSYLKTSGASTVDKNTTANSISSFITDGTNGPPRTGTKTSHTNRLAKYWKRTVL